MGGKNKERNTVTSIEISVILKRLTDKLHNAKRVEDFEYIKVKLIKLYEKIRQSILFLDFDEKRIQLLKECNINLQFLHRDIDAWNYFTQNKVTEAYDEIIATMKSISQHPDRHLIKPWIFTTIQESLQKIANLVANIPKQSKSQEKIQNITDHTFIHPVGVDIELRKTTIQNIDDQQTSLPNSIDPLDHPFPETIGLSNQKEIKADNINPFKFSNAFAKNSPNLNAIMNRDDNFDLTFKPSNLKPEKSLEKTFLMKEKSIPFPPTTDSSMDNKDNSIKKFWIKENKIDDEIKDNSIDNPFEQEIEKNVEDPFQTKKINKKSRKILE